MEASYSFTNSNTNSGLMGVRTTLLYVINYMKIPNQFHQFDGAHSLIVVAGKQDARIFDAHDGIVDELASVKLNHSDFFNDGPFYKAHSQGGMTRSGPVREVQDQQVVSQFIKELKKHLDKVRADVYSEVHVLAPSKSKNEIVKAMSSDLKSKVASVTEGNYCNESIVDIVRKVHKTDVHPFTARNKEERHILENAEKAHLVTKTRF